MYVKFISLRLSVDRSLIELCRISNICLCVGCWGIWEISIYVIWVIDFLFICRFYVIYYLD